MPATEAEIAQEAILSDLEYSEENEGNDNGMNTVRLAHEFDSEPKKSQAAFTPQLSLSRRPSLVLVELFLVSVIFASKFSQDKCYSIRSWAKLSGFAPWEIGRCERALCQALAWRSFVSYTM